MMDGQFGCISFVCTKVQRELSALGSACQLGGRRRWCQPQPQPQATAPTRVQFATLRAGSAAAAAAGLQADNIMPREAIEGLGVDEICARTGGR